MERQITGKALLRHLSHIAIVIFETDQFEGSHITTTVHFVGSQAVYDVESYRERSGIQYEGMPKAEFLEKIRALHVEEWQQQYYNRNAQDGEAWMLKIHFADGCGPLVIDGCNDYPPNFQLLRSLMTVPGRKKKKPTDDVIWF